MIEIHSHILFGLDDGAPDLAAAQQLARDYIAQGVHDVVCTPHLTTEHCQNPAVLATYLAKRNEVRARLSAWLAAENLPLRLHQGAEIQITSDTLVLLNHDAWREQLTLAHSDYILVELPSVLAGGYKALDQILFNIQILGLQPILAHPERAMNNAGFAETLAQWINDGRILTQVNNSSFVSDARLDLEQQHRYRRRQSAVEHLANHNLIHLTASDAHHPTRRPVQNQLARETLATRYGPHRAVTWTQTNPAKILANEIID